MPTKKLTALQVTKLTTPGRYNDGDGLYLYIDNHKRWVFRFRVPGSGKRRDMGLGSPAHVTLAEARELAANARKLLREGKDPIEERKTSRITTSASAPTFLQVVDEVLPELEQAWKNAKHKYQWRTTLTKDASLLCSKPINLIDTNDVLAVLKPIWTKKPETASRLRGRIEKMLDAAKAKNYRTGENPARWRGHLENLLPKRQRLTRGHHKAVPYQEVGAFIPLLQKRDGVAARALEFTILTAARSIETRESTWHEFDLKNAVWTVPPERMKNKKEHRVPLPPRSIHILQQCAHEHLSEFVFPGSKIDKPMSDMTLAAVLKRMKIPATPHGFRSTFKDWAVECTEFPNELSELALSHEVGSEVERAYRRGDMFQKRRDLMIAWENFLLGNVHVQTK